MGWSRQRRIILTRRKLRGDLAIAETAQFGQQRLSFPEINCSSELWEYAALMTSRGDEVLTRGQLYRDRAECENAYDELNDHCGWRGFTTHNLKRCRLLACTVALVYNWWSLFVRLADPTNRREISTRPMLSTAGARETQHVGQVKLTISSTRARQHSARRACLRIVRWLSELRQSAEQDPAQRWYRILSETLLYFRQVWRLAPRPRLNPARPTTMGCRGAKNRRAEDSQLPILGLITAPRAGAASAHPKVPTDAPPKRDHRLWVSRCRLN